MANGSEFTLAAIQATPVYFDREASTAKACRLIHEAASKGATVAAFGETWLPGYPFFAWSESSTLRWEAAEAYLAQAVEIPGPETNQLCSAAHAAGVDVVIGVAELDSRTRGTVYCTLLFIGREGQILGSHRKLKPTMAERLAWGEGNGDDFHVFDRSYGRLSGLNCWEHQMLLPAYTLMAQGAQVHVSVWPGGDPETVPELPVSAWARQELLSRAFAAQGACYVIAVGGLITPESVPKRFHELVYDDPISSMIIDPRGEVIARAPRGEEVILLCKADQSLIRAAKSANDIAGHYSRQDVFELKVRGVPVHSLSPLEPPIHTADSYVEPQVSFAEAGSTTIAG